MDDIAKKDSPSIEIEVLNKVKEITDLSMKLFSENIAYFSNLRKSTNRNIY